MALRRSEGYAQRNRSNGETTARRNFNGHPNANL